MTKTVALTNATGRQAASLARAAAAVGYKVRAHIAADAKNPLVVSELTQLPNTITLQGPLLSTGFIDKLLEGADLLFLNTTAFDEEVVVGKSFTEALAKSSIKHVVYSSMPDHTAGDAAKMGWSGLPQWKAKWDVETYMRSILGTRATYVYTGIYHNNFTSLPYPLFCMRDIPVDESGNFLKSSGDQAGNTSAEHGHDRKQIGFEWCAPFPADVALPWLDCEHDFGPAVLQIFKDGPKKWGSKRVPLAFDFLTPKDVCEAFASALDRPCRYVEGPITIEVPVPTGYREQLDALQRNLGGSTVDGLAAPYWWPGLFDIGRKLVGQANNDALKDVADDLWPGRRSMEEYAGEAFVIEERLNGRTWMHSDDSSVNSVVDGDNPSTQRNEIGTMELEEARPL